MKILDGTKGLLVHRSSVRTADWWVEIHLLLWSFLRREEADSLSPEYIENLEADGAMEIIATVKHCQPESPTVYEDK